MPLSNLATVKLTAYPGHWRGELNQLNTISNCTLRTGLKTTTLSACRQSSMPSQTMKQQTAHLSDELNDFYARFDRGNTKQSIKAVLTPDDLPLTLSTSDTLMASLAECLGPVQNSWLRSSPAFSTSLWPKPLFPTASKQPTLYLYQNKLVQWPSSTSAQLLLLPLLQSVLRGWFFPTWKHACPQYWTHTSSPTNPTGQLRMPSPQLSTLTWRTWTEPSHVRMLFIDFSSAFNTVIPSKLISKLIDVGISPSLCNWTFSPTDHSLLGSVTTPPPSSL